MPHQVDGALVHAMSGSELSRGTNRTPPTANIPNRCATSSTSEPPVSWPWPPWQCFSVAASPGAHSDAASPRPYAPLLAMLLPTVAQQSVALLADMSQPLLASTGVFARNQSHIAADLFTAWKPLRRPDDQHVGQRCQWA